jgi:arsenical pump membrane protein
MQVVLGLGIFAATLIGIFARPARLSEAHAALLGALAMLLTGIVSPETAAAALYPEWNVYLFFLGLMVTTALAERAGVFTMLARAAAIWANGSSRRLYLMLFLIGALVTAFLSNDATALLLTPVVATLVIQLRLSPVPYLFATTFIADTASFLLPVSNPINVLLLGERIDLPTFFRFLLAPALFAILANYIIFAWWFRQDLRMVYDLARLPVLDSRRQQTARLTLSGLAVLALVEVTAAWYHLPLGPVAVLGACALALLAWRIGQLDWKSLVRGISWSLFGFLTGMVIVVRGLTELGLTERFGTWLLALGAGSTLRAILVTAFGTALGANLINNVPMALVMRAALETSAPATLPQEALRYAALLGADLGPNVTTVGSLATILWVLLLRRYGITVSVRQYILLGFLLVPLLLAAGSLAIWLQL